MWAIKSIICWQLSRSPWTSLGVKYTSPIALALASSLGSSRLPFKVKANLSIHIIASLCDESITLSLTSLSTCRIDTFAYSSSSLCSWVAARLNFFLYCSMMAHMFSSVLPNCLEKLLFDLWLAFNLSSNIIPLTLDWSLSALWSLSSLLLPHKAPWNLFQPHSSFWAFFISHSNVAAVAVLTSLSSSHSFLTLMAVILNFCLTTCVLSSSIFKACTSSLSSGTSASSSLETPSFGSQVISCVRAFSHLW